MTYKKNCKLCGMQFKTQRDWQKFCSSEHQREYWKKVYSNQHMLNKRLEEVEKKLGIN